MPIVPFLSYIFVIFFPKQIAALCPVNREVKFPVFALTQPVLSLDLLDALRVKDVVQGAALQGTAVVAQVVLATTHKN